MNTIRWEAASIVPQIAGGPDGGYIRARFDLTTLHGEREYVRQAYVGDYDGDGEREVITRTMNANRARSLRLSDGSTRWVSEDISPPPEHSLQISQIGVDDIDGDGVAEVILATYQGQVICIDAATGESKWTRQLPWHINNPRLDIKKATPGPGKNVALTVGNDFDWCGPATRPRINFVRHPHLVLLDGQGEVACLVEDYAAHNGNGHNTWMYDVDDDGLCEVACSGPNELIWFKGDGRRLFALPCKGEGGRQDTHPDDVTVCNWDPERPGNEIVYLDGTDGIIVASSDGEVLLSKLFPKEVASHLQNVTPLPGVQPVRLLAENIRSRDSKLLCLDRELDVLWGAHMTNDMSGVRPLSRDPGGPAEWIVTGSHGKVMYNPHGVDEASLQLMRVDGTPLYQHRWHGESLCANLAAWRTGAAWEVLAGVGTPSGPEGRFSLERGKHMVLYLFRFPLL